MKNHIKTMRESRGLSMETLAHQIGAADSYVSHWESGRRPLHVEWLIRLGVALECHPWALVDDKSHLAPLKKQDIRLLNAFHRLAGHQRQAVLKLLDSIIEQETPKDRRR